MNRCVACGEIVPEGLQVCHKCLAKELGVPVYVSERCEAQFKAPYVTYTSEPVPIRSIEYFAEVLKDRIRTDVMPRFKTKNIDDMYRVGAEMCQLDIEILISKLLREFKDINDEDTRSN